ncbi:MAG: sulfur carrier protein ThiS [Bacteroidales bacterium]|nr:sulfur carrier protein ThiS [Bacteroidales bacterium]
MKITLNNREEEFQYEYISLSDLITEKNFTFKFLVTKVNGRLIKKEDREKIIVQDGDDVSVIHLISGG